MSDRQEAVLQAIRNSPGGILQKDLKSDDLDAAAVCQICHSLQKFGLIHGGKREGRSRRWLAKL